MAEWRPWSVLVMPRAEHDLERLDETTAGRVLDALAEYAATGHGSVKQLTGFRPPLFSLRVGVYRALFERDVAARRLDVLRVLHRSAAYR